MRAKLSLLRKDFGPLASDTRERKPTPFLKWAGGKGQLIEQIEPYLPRYFRTYYEPFLGGGALFFHLLPQKAVLSDSNDELINAYTVVRDSPQELMTALEKHSPHRRSSEYFYCVRAQDPDEMNRIERAARLIFLNKTCYNGLYRVNTKGHFNVPFGRYTNPQLFDRNNILEASKALRGKTLRVCDYRVASSAPMKDDFVYLDPPYQPISTTSSFTGYTKEAFAKKEQEDLAKVFEALHGRGCKVMVSNSATPLVRSLFKEYRVHSLRATRAINSKASGRGAIEELLITNY